MELNPKTINRRPSKKGIAEIAALLEGRAIPARNRKLRTWLKRSRNGELAEHLTNGIAADLRTLLERLPVNGAAPVQEIEVAPQADPAPAAPVQEIDAAPQAGAADPAPVQEIEVAPQAGAETLDDVEAEIQAVIDADQADPQPAPEPDPQPDPQPAPEPAPQPEPEPVAVRKTAKDKRDLLPGLAVKGSYAWTGRHSGWSYRLRRVTEDRRPVWRVTIVATALTEVFTLPDWNVAYAEFGQLERTPADEREAALAALVERAEALAAAPKARSQLKAAVFQKGYYSWTGLRSGWQYQLVEYTAADMKPYWAARVETGFTAGQSFTMPGWEAAYAAFQSLERTDSFGRLEALKALAAERQAA